MKINTRIPVLSALVAVLLAASHAHAATFTWSGGGADNNWNTVANWGGSAPTSGNALAFGGTTRLTPSNNITADTNFTGITFNSGAGNFTLSGNRITLGGDVTNSSSNTTQTINLDMILGSTRSFITTSGDVVVGGILSGTGGLTKSQGATSGARLLTLTGNNTYTGATTVGGGTVIVSGTVGTIKGSSGISIGINTTGGPNSAKLQLDNTAGNADRIGDTRTVTLYNQGELALIGNTTTSGTETIGGLSVGSGSRSSAGTVTLSGTSASVLTTLTSGNFTRVNNSTALIRGSSLGQAATNATRLTLTSTSGLTFVGTTTANGATPGSAKDVKIVPYLLGDTNAAGNGSSFVTYDTTGGLRPLSTSTEYTTLSAGYTAPTNKENVIAFNGTITAASPTVNSLLFNTASQTLNGSGTLTVQSGAIAGVAASVAIGSGFSSVTLGNGTWNEGVLTASGANVLTINAPIAVTGGSNGVLTKTGAGTVTLTAGSSYDAVTNVTQGTLAITHNNALGSTVGNTVVNGEAGGKLSLSNNITVAEPLTFQGQNLSNGPVLAVTSGVNTLTGPITAVGQQRYNVSVGASLTITGGVTGTDTFFVNNCLGTVAYTTTALNLGSGGNFYTDSAGLTVLGVTGNTFGTTTIGAGTLRLDVANALPSTSVVLIGLSYATAGTLDLNGNSQTINGLKNNTAAGTPSTRVVTSANAATLTLDSSTSYGFDGNTTGALTIIKNGANTQTFSGTGLHTGDTVVNSGTLALGSVNALQGSTLDTGTSGAQAVTFTVSGNNTYNLGGLKGSDDLAIGNNTISVGANNQSTSFTGVIGAGAGGLTKTGTGKWILGGVNTYTGATTVTAGTLLIGDTVGSTASLASGSTVSVGASGILGGHGSIGGATTITDGILAPGASAGSLELGGNLSLVASAGTPQTQIELGGTTFTLNVTEQYDRIKLTGATPTLTLAGTLNVSLINAFSLSDNQAFGIFQLNASANRSGTFGGLATDGSLVGTFGGKNLYITYSADFGDSGAVALTGGNDIALYTVPEPASWALLAFSLTTVMVLRRRRE